MEAKAPPLPTWQALWVLSRPKLLPYVLLLVAAGWGWAHWDRALVLQDGRAFGLVLIAWTLLNAGTLWLNAALDRDEGEVLMGRAVPPPPGIVGYAYVALVGCVLLAFAADLVAGLAGLGGAALAVAYSHPRLAWKQHPLGGPFVNFVGYGLLSPLAGYAVVDVGTTLRTLVVWPLGALGVLGCYFAAQAFQGAEDAARGDRTLVATHGPRVTLQVARLCIGIGIVGGATLAAVGWLPRVCLVVLPLGWWVDRWLVAWSSQPEGGDERWARGLAKRLLISGLLALALAIGDYVRASYAREPVAGLNTVGGHPPDRPLLAPAAMRRWEARQQAGSR